MESHIVLLYRSIGDGCFVAHSGLIDQIGTGKTKKQAIEDLKDAIVSLKALTGREKDIAYFRIPQNKLFEDFREELRNDPDRYNPRRETINRDLSLLIYDLGPVKQ
jgi:hypothetical protein